MTSVTRAHVVQCTIVVVVVEKNDPRGKLSVLILAVEMVSPN